ncbi:MAG: ArsR family transcriptional regulator [Candidatus Methanoperedenaceae archaeon]|nr:MAG: ArsR family transcriptional regulator [Candidatus Methanoperedenaceae archaeon]
MQDNESGEEKLLILPLGEESKKITQVISNDTARKIIELLADAPLSATDIADRLQAPLTTIAYNLENLESVGLVKVERIKYSEKGREVKIYAPVRKLIVVVPEKTDRKSVTDLIRKYLGVILAAVLASSFIEFFMTRRSEKIIQDVSPMPAGALNETMKSVSSTSPVATPIVPQLPDAPVTIYTNLANTITAHPGLLFLMGCLFMVALLIVMDYHRKRRNG